MVALVLLVAATVGVAVIGTTVLLRHTPIEGRSIGRVRRVEYWTERGEWLSWQILPAPHRRARRSSKDR